FQRPALEALEDRTVPSTLHVTNPFDDGSEGSLRSTLARANDRDKIDFNGSLAGQTITLNGPLSTFTAFTLEGPAGANRVTISGAHQTNIFDISPGSSQHPTVSISNLNIVDGYFGGIDAVADSTLVLNVNDCSFSGNVGSFGGAINAYIISQLNLND